VSNIGIEPRRKGNNLVSEDKYFWLPLQKLSFISLLLQEFSWSNLRITHQTFQKIISHHSIFAPFLDVVLAYGSRTQEDEKCWDGCHSRVCEEEQEVEHSQRFGKASYLASESLTDSNDQEFCYNLRYVERNGRNQGNPWSLRQTGVYHSYDRKSQKSIWIILQPSTFVLENIEHFVRSLTQDDFLSRGAYILLHCFILSSMEKNWRDYIEDLQARLNNLVSLAQIISTIT
jgi:hypothetical protein